MHKLVLLYPAHGIFRRHAANAQPFRPLSIGEELARPVGDTLLDQREARDRDDDGLCL
jgi:hypothetical protein